MKRMASILLVVIVAGSVGCRWLGTGRGAAEITAAGGKVAQDGPAEPLDLVAQYGRGLRTRRLDNGLVVITKENHAAPVASVYVMINAGGILEGEYLGSGISHLTEHLVSGGTTNNRTEKQIREAIADIGAVTNAMTGSNTTTYFIRTTPDHVGTAIELLADNMTGCTIPQKEFDREFGVVQREILTGASNPRRQLSYLLNEMLFPNMPQGMRTIGYYKNIQAVTRDDVVKYYKRRYVPSNAVVVAAGDFDGAKVLAQLQEAFGSWEGPHPRPVVLPEPAPPVSDLVAVKEMDMRLAHGIVAYHSCRLSHPDLYPLDVLANILGDGDSSRLGADLKVKRNLVYGIGAWNYTPHWPGGEFGVNFVCDPDKVDQVRKAIAEHLAAVCETAPSDKELEKVKTQVIAAHLMRHRTADAQARSLASDQLHLGDPLFSARYVENIQKVRAEDVLRMARKYLASTRSVTAIVRPKKEAAPEEAAAAESLKPTTTRTIFPGSGLTLLVYRAPGQPAVSITAVMKAGQSLEPAEHAGLSSMVAAYLTRGTTQRDENQIAEFFDSMGGSIGASSGWNTIYVRAISLKKDFGGTLDVFSDVVLRPAFSPELLESTRRRQLAALRSAQNTALGQCGLYFNRQFFLDGPYRFPSTGSEKTIAALTPQVLREFYQRVRCGRNMVLVVAGDVDPSEVEEMVKAQFATLAAGEPGEPAASVSPRKTDQAEVHIKKIEKQEAAIMVGYAGTDLYNLRDRFAMDVFDTICSGYRMPRGWLHETLRGQSLVYAVHFYGRLGLLPGYYRSYAVCEPEKATRVARLLRDLVHSGHQYKFTEDDLKRAKSTILTARQMGRQLPEEVAFEMALDELFGLGYNFGEKLVERVNAVTIEDLKRVIGKYIGQPVICIATPKPEEVDLEELRRPYDAEVLEKMRELTPQEIPTPRQHVPPQ